MNKEENRIKPQLRFPEFENDWDWEETQLGKLGQFLGGGTPSRANSEYWKGTIPWISSSDINDDDIHNIVISQYINETAIIESATKIIPIGSVLFVSRVGVGKLAINNVELCTSQDFTSFIPKDVFNLYVAYFYSSNKNSLQSLSQGTSIKGFSINDLKDSTIFFPKNPKEQQKIAACLSSLDEFITAETEKLDLLQDHKKGLLQQLFPAEGETQPNFRFPEFLEDGEWVEKGLKNLILNISPPKKLKSNQFNETGKYPIIDQSQNEIAGWTDDDEAIIKTNYPLVVFGDHTCILKIVEKPFVQGADGIKIFKGNKLVDTRYLFYALQRNPLIMKEYKRHYSILKEKTIIYPDVNTGEQQKIAQCLSAADALIEAQTRKIEALQEHKKGLLQQLFPNVNEVAV